MTMLPFNGPFVGHPFLLFLLPSSAPILLLFLREGVEASALLVPSPSPSAHVHRPPLLVPFAWYAAAQAPRASAHASFGRPPGASSASTAAGVRAELCRAAHLLQRHRRSLHSRRRHPQGVDRSTGVDEQGICVLLFLQGRLHIWEKASLLLAACLFAGVGCFGRRKDELWFLLLCWRKSQMDDVAADAWSCDGKSEEGNKEKSSHWLGLGRCSPCPGHRARAENKLLPRMNWRLG
jgi:hypothetical protein